MFIDTHCHLHDEKLSDTDTVVNEYLRDGVDIAINMLIDLELYASQCFDNTHRHLYNVKQLTTIEEIEAYDHTLGYPENKHYTI